MSGWKALAAQFRAAEPPPGEVLRKCVIGIGPGPGVLGAITRNHAGPFGVSASAAGLYLDAGSPHRYGWPPLLVPWSDIRLIAKRQLLGRESFELRLGRSTSYLTVTRRAFAIIEPFLEQ